jgi:alpha-amylase/alpha-mannosidase (GH57 family)
MERYVCIHGHFYQPPRENPWLEEVELQDSAYPFHDWNTRINEECYRQNAASRILSSDRKIINIVNNYSNISFNFGPTLLSWLEYHAPDVYENIIEADRKSREQFSGHGSAIAQAYNHMILPLANTRDKHTQVIWGIWDFEHRFGRKPEGMWLPEAAVNIETLEVLADHEIRFTILSPNQARKVRKTGIGRWADVTQKNLDTTMPYVCFLPSGKSIVLFFYNGIVANDVAYGGLLHSGKDLADRLIQSFTNNNNPAQLVHIATDGESFGHHHRYGDMALAYCLHYIRTNNLAKVTVYSEYLEKFPPTHEVQINENTSWSCAHGIERWRSNCGCSMDKSTSGKQQWRGPLRNAMDWLRDRCIENFEKEMIKYCPDPWKVRNDYIKVILDRSEGNVEDFITQAAGKELDQEDKIKFLKLMEMQRMAMLMFSSDGWFFDKITGIETLQVLEYAARAMQLYHEIAKTDVLDQFKAIIVNAPASGPNNINNGRDVYVKYVEPVRIDLNRVAAHLALSSVFLESMDQEQEQEIYCYIAEMLDYKDARAGIQKLATGKLLIRSNIVLEHYQVDFATLYLGSHNLFTTISSPIPEENFQQIRKELDTEFYDGRINEVMRQINLKFGGNNYTIWHLFKDEQRRLVHDLLSDTWDEAERSFRHIYEQNYSIMLMLRNMNMNLPKVLAAPAEFIINQDLCREIEAEEINVDRLKELTDEAERLSLQLDKATLKFEASAKINNSFEMFEQARDDINLLQTIVSALKILKSIVPDMDLQLAQNLLFTIAKEKYPEMKEKANSGIGTRDSGLEKTSHEPRVASDKNKAAKWVELFEQVADHLGIVI